MLILAILSLGAFARRGGGKCRVTDEQMQEGINLVSQGFLSAETSTCYMMFDSEDWPHLVAEESGTDRRLLKRGGGRRGGGRHGKGDCDWAKEAKFTVTDGVFSSDTEVYTEEDQAFECYSSVGTPGLKFQLVSATGSWEVDEEEDTVEEEEDNDEGDDEVVTLLDTGRRLLRRGGGRPRHDSEEDDKVSITIVISQNSSGEDLTYTLSCHATFDEENGECVAEELMCESFEYSLGKAKMVCRNEDWSKDDQWDNAEGCVPPLLQ